MNKETGRLVLASGNIFRWEHVQVTGRGGIRGDFVSEPSSADIAEAKAFSVGKAPNGSRYRDCVTDERHAKSALNQHITGGTNN